jgi:hypothetical protein
MAVVISLFGLFRISKNAPDCRRYYFTSMLWDCVAMWTFGDSNIGGATDNYTFDVFTPFGFGCVLLGNLVGGYWTLKYIDEAITGPMTGRDTLPLVSSRWSGVLVQSFFFFVFTFLQINILFWSICDYQGYQEIALPFSQLGYERFTLVAAFTTNGLQSFSALFATLLFEKKMNALTATALNVLILVLFSTDLVTNFVIDESTPQYAAVVPLAEWMSRYGAEFPTPWILGGTFFFTVANAFRRRIALGNTD